MSAEYDEDLVSRQLGVYGKETMGKLASLSVLVVGMRGLGAEVAKNLILAGPKKVDIIDPTTVAHGDLSANFYLEPDDVDEKQRDEACVSKLAELNSYVEVEVVSGEIDKELIDDYDVVVVTEIFEDIDEIIKIDQICRDSNKGFILSQCLGAYGYAFVDFGDDFVVKDKTGEEHKSFNIVGITNAKEGELTVHKGKTHTFSDGDYVVFREIKGMNELNNLKDPVKISVIDSFTLKLHLDTSKFGKYKIDGIVTSVNVPTPINFQSLEDSIVNPVIEKNTSLLMSDFSLFGRPEQLHLGLQAIYKFQQEYRKLPKNCKKHVHKVLDLAIEINNDHKKNKKALSVDEIDKVVVKLMSKFSRSEITPMTSFFGGIVCQEVVKFTGKFTPLTNQWFHYDMFLSLPNERVDREPAGGRYDDQILIFGRDFQKKIEKQRIFLIGAGALGCELMKCFALMGLACSEEGVVHVTDNDNIELSNLNRQFLFRNEHIGQPKSRTASDQAQGINSDLNVKPYENLVCPDTENIFNEKFWNKIDFVVNAVDNRKARLYVDSKCVWHKKALLDSGTLGTKANTQMVIPKLTECYGDSTDPEEESIPMCTLRNFPNQIEHCIEWGKNKFGELFNERPSELRSFLTDKEAYINKVKKNNIGNQLLKELKKLKQILELKDFEDCVGYMKQRFCEDYEFQISSLIKMFPETHKDESGNPFWSGPKRFPKPIEFDKDDDLHLDYIFAGANLIADCLCIAKNNDRDEVANMAEEAEVDEDVPVEINLEDEEEKKGSSKSKAPASTHEVSKEEIDEIVEEILNMDGDKDEISPAEFEKDDSTNHHVDFIHASAMLRARNYRLDECDKFKTKMIAGKIIPAIATTTAAIVGVVCMELCKIVQGFNDLSDYRNAYINLGINLFVMTEPGEPKKNKDVEMDPIMLCPIKAIPPNWTIWDTIELKGSLTVSEMMKHFREKYQVSLSLITTGDKAIYNEYANKEVMKERQGQKIEDIYRIVCGKKEDKEQKYILLDIGGATISDKVDVSMPKIKYMF